MTTLASHSGNELQLRIELDSLYKIWQVFCEKHTELYELTCDEYIKLLASDIDELEVVMNHKNVILEEINNLDQQRKDIIASICPLMNIETPVKLNELLDVLRAREENSAYCINLEKINLLLIGIIQKIQEQNKKNQIFLNKAIVSLKELKTSFNGSKNYNTYGSNGLVK